jgi:chromosome segregation ATPase
MTDKDEPSLGHIPPIVPARDEVVSRQSGGRQKARPGGKQPTQGGGAGILARLFIVIALVVAAVACAWAWQLQQKLDATTPVLALYEDRISDLEDRLSDTDEGMNQSAATLGVKIKELASEVDKLWASAWRKNKAKIAALEKSSSAHGSQLSTLANTDKTYSNQLKSLAGDITKLRSVAADLEKLVANAKANQAMVESLGDDVSRATLEVAKLQKRVQAGEEWQASVDGFRKQVNKSLIRLQRGVGELQGSAAPPAGAATN